MHHPDEFAPDNLLAPEQIRRHPLATFFVELIKVTAVAATVIILIRYFLFKPFIVKGASMEPNFFEKEYLIVDELTYRFVEPKRGEIVVIRHENDSREYFIKRIVGLPGDRIIITDGRVRIANKQNPSGIYIDESDYLSPNVLTQGDTDVTLGSDEYFVLGDNRAASLDSRRIGPVPKPAIVGRALLRGWPLTRVDILTQ